MTREEFDIFVNSVEQQAAQNSKPIKGKVLRLILLGYACFSLFLLVSIFGVLISFVLVLSAPNIITFKVAIIVGFPCGALAFSLFKALKIRFYPPVGVLVDKESAPELFRLIAEVSRLADPDNENGKGIPLKQVMISPDLNAGVTQIPRLGIFGFYQNYLVLGLPLLQALSVEELKAVLAHEFAHLSGHHSKTGNWIYRTRNSWERVIYILGSESSWSARLVSKFLGWFWPRLNGYAFALSRGQEYEADRFAADVSGVATQSSALMKIELTHPHCDKSWREIYDSVATISDAPKDVFGILKEKINELSTEDANDYLTKAFRLKTDTSDTHPCLKDRLISIGFLEKDAGESEFEKLAKDFQQLRRGQELPTAESKLLTKDLQKKILDHYNREWFENTEESWKSRHDSLIKTRNEIQELKESGKEKSNSSDEDIDHLNELLGRLSNTGESDAACEVAKKILRLNPNHVSANFFIGHHYIEKGNPIGVTHINKIMDNPFHWNQCADILYQHYRSTGNHEELSELKKSCDAFDEKMELFNKERSKVDLGNLLSKPDSLIPHSMKATQLEELRKIFIKVKQLKKVYLVEKETSVYPEIPMYVFSILIKCPFFTFKPVSEADVLNRVSQLIRIKEPATIMVYSQKVFPKLHRKISKKNKNLIFKRPTQKELKEMDLPE